MNRNGFAGYHPLINFVYFTAVLLFGMFFVHPIMQVISLVSASCYSIMLRGRRAVRFQLLYMLPLLLAAALFNPAFNHAGVTILFYLKSGNPITLESILYGISSACMLITVLIWFSCYNAVMTSDKFIYLFGKLIPALSLILSMVLRFVPRYKDQIRRISYAQRSIGKDVSQGNLLRRARNGLTILSIMTTWALENAIETADSMKSRGYGLPRRTSYSLYRLDNRDKGFMAVMLSLIIIVVIGEVNGENTMRFFPSVQTAEVTPFSILIYAAYLGLCMMPVIQHMMEAIKWKSIASKM
ncbi:energy-coupling factor transporter transmembrane protein EcfT [Paenibacillus glycanilyticus]|uniref:energy-coupling factor transporter transmembrane component T n=1 Tax=Paenibacillus glycanilyticus TaxID=126569 RepID=UPI00204262A5|nr:energy-coupling factor transporter transmembrane component T [Paenibacillus glycanilyticus]MCM3629919.1 energy-coupling factor transporter transmembrane protein EcfT [Paenibacillus glycanilyticus]